MVATTAKDPVFLQMRDKVEERVALELTPRSQRCLADLCPKPNPEWQELPMLVFLRDGPADGGPLCGGLQVGDTAELRLAGIGRHPRLVALQFEGLEVEGRPPRLVMYKGLCTRQEEGRAVTVWERPAEPLSVRGVVRPVWRVRPPRRTNNSRRRQALAKRQWSLMPATPTSPTSRASVVAASVASDYLCAPTPPVRPTSIPLSVHELQSFFSRPTSLEVVEVSLAAQASQAPYFFTSSPDLLQLLEMYNPADLNRPTSAL